MSEQALVLMIDKETVREQIYGYIADYFAKYECVPTRAELSVVFWLSGEAINDVLNTLDYQCHINLRRNNWGFAKVPISKDPLNIVPRWAVRRESEMEILEDIFIRLQGHKTALKWLGAYPSGRLGSPSTENVEKSTVPKEK